MRSVVCYEIIVRLAVSTTQKLNILKDAPSPFFTSQAACMLVPPCPLEIDATGIMVQGRGGSTGYDNAVALPARSDSDELAKENNKSVAALKGQAVFSVAKVRCACHTVQN